MIGCRVTVQRLPEREVGGVHARAYTLRHGGALVIVEASRPHRLLRMGQPTDFGSVDATLLGTPAGDLLLHEQGRDREGGVRARRKR